MQKVMKSLLVLAALAAAALGGSALADAAGNKAGTAAPPPAANGAPPPGPHVGANGKREQALSGDTAAKVKAAALDEYPGATIERVETDVDHGSPYEAHLTTSGGKQLEVLVNEDFEVTDAHEMQHP
jgi:hypothetical protein